MIIKKEKTIIVYNKYKNIEDIYDVIKSYGNKYIDFTFNTRLNENNISLEILYTPGYSKMDAYGINGRIYKYNNIFVYSYKENINLLDYFSIFGIVLFVIVFLVSCITEGINGSIIPALNILFALLIIYSLFYMRKKILSRLYKFIEDEMK